MEFAMNCRCLPQDRIRFLGLSYGPGPDTSGRKNSRDGSGERCQCFYPKGEEDVLMDRLLPRWRKGVLPAYAVTKNQERYLSVQLCFAEYGNGVMGVLPTIKETLNPGMDCPSGGYSPEGASWEGRPGGSPAGRWAHG